MPDRSYVTPARRPLVAALVLGLLLLLAFVAILLASALEPFIGWIRAHVALGRGATVLVVYAVFFALVLGLALVILPTAYTQAEETIARRLSNLSWRGPRWTRQPGRPICL